MKSSPSLVVLLSVLLVLSVPVLFVVFKPLLMGGKEAARVEKIEKGISIYNENCASCHGISMKGTNQGPPFIHRVYVPSHHGDQAFHLAVEKGVRAHHWPFGDMPAIPGLEHGDVSAVIEYIRHEQRKNGIK
jgi:cytochrome c